jgi:uncharacterized membrane protein
MERTRFERAANAVLETGRPLFSLAIIALGIETMVCSQYVSNALGPHYRIIPVLPFLPAIPWLAYVFGTIFAVCGVGLVSKRTLRPAALALGCLLLLCTLVLEIPKNLANIGNMSLRTGVFEPLALGCLAWLLPGCDAIPRWLARTSRYLLALSLVVFGVDHFLALAPIGALIPNWIPWHVFWRCPTEHTPTRAYDDDTKVHDCDRRPWFCGGSPGFEDKPPAFRRQLKLSRRVCVNHRLPHRHFRIHHRIPINIHHSPRNRKLP